MYVFLFWMVILFTKLKLLNTFHPYLLAIDTGEMSKQVGFGR